MDKGWLEGYRALDLTNEYGHMCGWVLGSLGVDVVKIEKPGGDPSRRIGPFYGDCPDPQRSLSWFAYNANKRSITLNLDSEDGRSLFRRLVETSDFVLESYPPGHMGALGLGYGGLCIVNPRIIMVSITAFGQSGPYRDYKGSEIVAEALSGLMYSYGHPDGPPTKFVSGPYAFPVASVDGAVGALIALSHRFVTGDGQHVDVSAQHSLATCTFSAGPDWLMSGDIVVRQGAYRIISVQKGTRQRVVWESLDGHVVFMLMGGQIGVKSNTAIVEWMKSESMAVESMLGIDWKTFDLTRFDQEEIDILQEPVARFFQKHTTEELYQGALERGTQLCPVSSPKDLLENAQLSARGFWTSVQHPELGTTITYPGPLQPTAESPRPVRRAPLIGEHNEEIYERELGLSKKEVICLKEGGII